MFLFLGICAVLGLVIAIPLCIYVAVSGTISERRREKQWNAYIEERNKRWATMTDEEILRDIGW